MYTIRFTGLNKGDYTSCVKNYNKDENSRENQQKEKSTTE